MAFSPLVEQLITALRCLPGVGPKTAQRMAIALLQRGRQNGKRLADSLHQAMEQVGHCASCRTFSETPSCTLCANPRRDQTSLCIVENPADIYALEQTGQHRGVYFVLMGLLSPLDGIGPEQIGMESLTERFMKGGIKEVILGMSPTVEGETTAHYISLLTKKFSIKPSRLAYGIPIGGDLDFVDANTLAHAFLMRTEYTS